MMSRTNSRTSQVGRNSNRNKSNSNVSAVNRIPSSENLKQNQLKQTPAPGLRILGQDREVSEDELWDLSKGKTTPTSSRSNASPRPGSSASRGTPSRQVTLQAVRRKEDSDEPIEPIDWNEFNRAVSLNERQRIPSPIRSDSDSGEESLSFQKVLSPEEQQALVDQRAKELTTALSSHRPDNEESVLSARLTKIEQERALREQLEKDREEQLMKLRLKADNDTKYRNDHYINLSARDDKNRISSSFILDDKDKNKGAVNKEIGEDSKPKPVKRTGENVIGKHVMDRPQETAVSASTSSEKPDAFITEVQSESAKKNEASAKSDESEDDSSDSEDEDDVIGRKGKAPNQLLMEFVTCLMEQDYENAEKLCKMILIYEPENKEALSFFPLIKEKREQEVEEEDSGEEGSDSGEEEDDDDDDDDDDDESRDDDDDDDDDDEESSEEESDDGRFQSDSGIASANSD